MTEFWFKLKDIDEVFRCQSSITRYFWLIIDLRVDIHLNRILKVFLEAI